MAFKLRDSRRSTKTVALISGPISSKIKPETSNCFYWWINYSIFQHSRKYVLGCLQLLQGTYTLQG